MFLRRFVERTKAGMRGSEGQGAFRYPCLDAKAKPGWPEGAEVLAAWLLYDFIEARFGVTPSETSQATGSPGRQEDCSLPKWRLLTMAAYLVPDRRRVGLQAIARHEASLPGCPQRKAFLSAGNRR